MIEHGKEYSSTL